MNIDKALDIIDGYASWWRDNVEAYQEGNSVRIICPMLDRNNDHMSFYLADDDVSGGYVLSDIGSTIMDLAASGCDVLASNARKRKLEQTVCGYGVQLVGNELYVKASGSDLFSKMNMLMQSMASVDDLFFTARENVRSFFLDDVTKWLDENQIRYVPNIRVSGKSGFETKFDFVIPKSRDVAPERYIKAVGNPSKSSVMNALFGWNDISQARGNAKSYIFLNALGSREGNVEPSLLQACTAYEVKPVIWDGSANDVLEELAA